MKLYIKYISTILIFATTSLLLQGCNGQMNKQSGGTLIGGLAGGLLGSQFGGGEVFLGHFTDAIKAEHVFIGGSKAIFNLFQSKNYKAIFNDPAKAETLAIVRLDRTQDVLHGVGSERTMGPRTLPRAVGNTPPIRLGRGSET